MKTKILMTFLAVFFLATGSAIALPVVEYTVEGNVLNFSVYNDLADFGISKVGFHVADISESWTLPSGVEYAASNGYDWFWVDPYVYGADTITNIMITVSSVPNAVDYGVVFSSREVYEGNDVQPVVSNVPGYNRYLVWGNATATVASVPEPITFILLGLGFLGVAGLKRNIQK